MRTFAIAVIAALACFGTNLQVGFAQEVENFTLEAVLGSSDTLPDSTFELKAHKGKTVVLHFLLKTECPYCLRYTNQYAKLAESNPEVIHLFIKPDSKDEILGWMKKLAKTDSAKMPTIYRDPDAKLAKQLGIPKGYRFHGQNVHYPALIVLNGEGKEVFRYIGKSNQDRMPTDDFVKKLASLTGK